MQNELKPCRDRLIELIQNAVNGCARHWAEIIADHLLANGAVVLNTGVISPKNRQLITHFAGMPINDVLDLVRAKREGRIIAPPCKVGDTVYRIEYCSCGNPEAYEMKRCHKKVTKKTPKVYGSVMLRQDGKRLNPKSYMSTAEPKWERRPIGTICYKIIKKPFKLEWLTEIGKTVFLTKEEAEKALAMMDGKDGAK